MPLDEQQTWALLRELDEPGQWEFPDDHDHAEARARFDRLVARLDRRFGCSCAADRQVQDASHLGTIIVPATATTAPAPLTVTISKFGRLAAVSLGNPGSYDEDEERALFPIHDRRRIEEELQTLGYHPVAEHLLWTRYNGISGFDALYPPDRPPSWWARFFDYL